MLSKVTEDYLLSNEVSDAEKDLFTSMLPLHEIGVEYNKGDKLVYESVVYEVIQKHTSQKDWKPNELPALYKLFYQTSTSDGTEVIPKWKQPLGGHDSYNTGDLVEHNNLIWESEIDNNVWEPGVYGWIEYKEV